jgi:hypothetical protein
MGTGGGAAPGGDAGDVGDAGDTGNGDGPALVLHCPPLPAAVELTITDERGAPLRNAGFILRQQGVIVPQRVLAATFSSEETVAAGLADGFLTSVSLAPLTDTELQLRVSSPGSRR